MYKVCVWDVCVCVCVPTGRGFPSNSSEEGSFLEPNKRVNYARTCRQSRERKNGWGGGERKKCPFNILKNFLLCSFFLFFQFIHGSKIEM